MAACNRKWKHINVELAPNPIGNLRPSIFNGHQEIIHPTFTTGGVIRYMVGLFRKSQLHHFIQLWWLAEYTDRAQLKISTGHAIFKNDGARPIKLLRHHSRPSLFEGLTSHLCGLSTRICVGLVRFMALYLNSRKSLLARSYLEKVIIKYSTAIIIEVVSNEDSSA